jgi:hypothetical protein
MLEDPCPVLCIRHRDLDIVSHVICASYAVAAAAACCCQVVPHKFSGNADIVPLEFRQAVSRSAHNSNCHGVLAFV